MNKLTLTIALIVIGLLSACAPDKPKADSESYEDAPEPAKNAVAENSNPAKGLGQVTQVELKTPLEQERIGRGKAIYDMKCQACHKLTEEKLVGPGWKGVTSRNTAEWIMNFITNTDVMLNKDPKAKAQLEICLVRMPNQSLSDDDARNLLEFMRKNDGVK